MSGFPSGSSAADVFPRPSALTPGPVPLGGGAAGLPVVNNPNLPSYSTLGGANLPPPVPQPPLTPFPAIRPSTGPSNSMISNNYATANTLPSTNATPVNRVCRIDLKMKMMMRKFF